MLELRPICERCGVGLAPDSARAFICSHECTFCRDCSFGPLGGRCPNCRGELQPRPRRLGDAPPPRDPAATHRPADPQADGSALAALLAREQIRDVLHDYCHAVDRGDAALMKACYHPDGTDDHGFFSGLGWDFADYVLPRLAQLDRSIHSLTNPRIRLEGERAFVETQWSVIHRLPRLGRLTDLWHQGRYLDEFTRRDGRWRIQRRVTVLDAERWFDTTDLQALVPDDHPQKVHRGRRGAGDPVHRIRELGTLTRPAFALGELWRPLRQALALPRWLLHAMGVLARRRGGYRTVSTAQSNT